ncbi:MAG TPA: HAD family hydrolase [Gemmatimonadales bacterium]|nr:HAD family hydrolase [Gemmatimonadales bacterium]
MSGVPAVFLDRDGTLIEDTSFVRDPAEVRLIAGATAAVARFNAAGWRTVVVTNQSGIARGLLSEADYARVAAHVSELFAAAGARLDVQLHCPHHPDITGDCRCRKPATGLYEDAIARLGIDPRVSWYIGDRLRDLLPAQALGGTGLHVLSGDRSEDAAVSAAGFRSVADLAAAAGLILG